VTSSAGPIALVTGGSRGIGRAIVLDLARVGFRIRFSYAQDEASAAETALRVRAAGGEVEPARVDVASSGEVEAWVDAIAGRDGRIDVLVNNAGAVSDVLLAFQEEEEWRRILAVNLDGVRHASRAVLRVMIAERRGRIISVASTSALTGRQGQTAYAAAKGGVLAFTRSLAREVAPLGITVNAVVPGPIETEMTAALPEKNLRAILEAIPLKRVGRPEEVAAAVSYLASEAGSYITGTSLRVDGGIAM
jgi:3-oxoacyl-[acyl-carrier protein] reductase